MLASRLNQACTTNLEEEVKGQINQLAKNVKELEQQLIIQRRSTQAHEEVWHPCIKRCITVILEVKAQLLKLGQLTCKKRRQHQPIVSPAH